MKTETMIPALLIDCQRNQTNAFAVILEPHFAAYAGVLCGMYHAELVV